MHRSRSWLALLAGIVVAGCTSDLTAPVQDPCLVATLVTVKPIEPVRFGWEPCGMSVLYVRPEAGGATSWWIESDTNNIQSPITYGVVPDGVDELAAPAPLEAGKEYRVTIVRRRGPKLNDLTAVGATVFTLGLSSPPPARPTQWRFADSRSVRLAAGFGLPLHRDAEP